MDKKQAIAQYKQLQGEYDQVVKDLDNIVIDQDNKKEKEKVMTSNIEAAVNGATRGFTYGLDDNANATTTAMEAVILDADQAFDKGLLKGLDKSISTFKENYNKQMVEEKKARELLQKNHPTSYELGDLIGSMASFGGAAKGLKAVGKALGTGFMHGVGRSEEETLGGKLEEGAEGAAVSGLMQGGFNVAGPLVKKGIQKVGTKAQGLQKDKFLNFLRGDSGSSKLKEINLDEKLKNTQLEEWVDRLLGYTSEDGKFVLGVAQTAKSARMSTARALKETGDEMGKILSSADEAIAVDVDSLSTRLKNVLVKPLQSDTQKLPQERAVGRKLSEYIDDLLYIDDRTQTPTILKMKNGDQVVEKIVYPKKTQITTMQSLNDSKSKLLSAIKEEEANGNIRFADHLRKLALEMHGYIDDTVKVKAPKLQTKLRASSEKYKDLYHLEEALKVRAKTSNEGNFAKNLFLRSLNRYTVGGIAAASMLGVDLDSVGAVALGLSTIMGHPQTNKVMAMGLNPIVTALKKNPNKYYSLATRLKIAAEQKASDVFIDEVHNAAAEIELTEQPLMRTAEDVVNRKDDILTVLSISSPLVADKLRKAIEQGDKGSIGQIMSQMPNNRMVQGGIGWDGIAHTQKDVATIETFIKDNIVNTKQQWKMMKEFRSKRMIPTEYYDRKMLQKKNTPFEKQPYQKAKDKALKRDF